MNKRKLAKSLVSISEEIEELLDEVAEKRDNVKGQDKTFYRNVSRVLDDVGDKVSALITRIGEPGRSGRRPLEGEKNNKNNDLDT